jgi:hypothetical protein
MLFSNVWPHQAELPSRFFPTGRNRHVANPPGKQETLPWLVLLANWRRTEAYKIGIFLILRNLLALGHGKVLSTLQHFESRLSSRLPYESLLGTKR